MADIKNASGTVIFTTPGSDLFNFDSIDLRGANLAGAVIEGGDFSQTDLSDASLEGCDLYWVLFFQADLRRANLRFGRFRGCDFKETDLRHADLTGACFGLDNVGGSTQLEGANLSHARIAGTIFEQATYDAHTIFPADFNPKDHNLIFQAK